jgi:hypothetical protein
MGATIIERREASVEARPAPAGRGGPAPIYVVCSPSRGVGKTLLARLLIEHHLADGRPVAAYDLADEGPRLADFLPNHARVASIRSVRDQMRFFDGLIEGNESPKIIDVSYREFRTFFAVADRISLFEEARRRSIEPLILFLIDPAPAAAESYAQLRRRFAGTSLLPVRNLTVARGLPYGAAFPHGSTLAVSLEIPVLGPAARAQIERQAFSFAGFARDPRTRTALSARPRDELESWLRRLRFQFREIELGLICEQILTALQ